MIKEDILKGIHHLIYNNVFCSDPNSTKWTGIAANGYEKRILGFKAEIEFKRKLKAENKFDIFDGGILLPLVPKSKSIDQPVYLTISSNPINEDYKNIYSKLSKLNGPRLFFVHYLDQDYVLKDIMDIGVYIRFTDCNVYEFLAGEFVEQPNGINEIKNTFSTKSYKRYKGKYKLREANGAFIKRTLGHYERAELLDILMTRLFFDGHIGFGKKKGIVSDIDLIVKDKSNQQYTFLEIKEKDRSKTPPHGFGMDISRMNDILDLSSITQTSYAYIVKHVNNQTERKFIEWLSINMHDFKKETAKKLHVRDGGRGMATATSSKPKTVVVGYEAFDKV